MKKEQCHHIIFWITLWLTKPFSQNSIIVYLSIYLAVKLNLYETGLDWKLEALPMEPDDITVLQLLIITREDTLLTMDMRTSDPQTNSRAKSCTDVSVSML